MGSQDKGEDQQVPYAYCSRRHMGSATGVAKEIRMAKDNNVPCLGVYVDGAGRTSTLPKGLPRNHTIRWDWDKIAEAVEKARKEGKNKDVKSRLQ